MSNLFFVLAIISVACGIASSIIIAAFLSKRGIRINYLFFRVFDLPPLNATKYNVVKRGKRMANKGFKPEQVINKLREAEVLLTQGATVGEVCRKIGVTDVTYYRWRKEYGGMTVGQARRHKDLEQENSRLKKLVADLSLDNAILKEAGQGNL